MSGIDRIHSRQPATIHRLFPVSADSAAAARRELERLDWALSEDELQVLSLLVTELIANSVQHGGGENNGYGSIGVTVAVGATMVRGEVSDDGDGFVPEPQSEGSLLDSHWGLHLLDELTARWDIIAEPNTVVTFELDRMPRLRAPFPSRV